nr:hypothetical protein [Mucilaginibacter sp. SP1R1]
MLHPTSPAFLHFFHKIKLVILSDSERSILRLAQLTIRSFVPQDDDMICNLSASTRQLSKHTIWFVHR